MNKLDNTLMFRRTLFFDRHFLSSFPIELSNFKYGRKFFCSFLTEAHEFLNRFEYPRLVFYLFTITISSGMKCVSNIYSTNAWHMHSKSNFAKSLNSRSRFYSCNEFRIIQIIQASQIHFLC